MGRLTSALYSGALQTKAYVSISQVPGTPQTRPPQSFPEPELRCRGESEPGPNPGLPVGTICQLRDPLKKSLKNSGVLGAPPNLRAPGGSHRHHSQPCESWGSGQYLKLVSNPRLPVPCPQIPARSKLGGRGTKAGREARARRGRVWRQFEAHLMAAWRAGGAPTGGCSRGAPGCRFRGSGLAPGSAQSPPGSRPIESGFLEGTWTGPGRVLGRLFPLGI